MKKKMLVFRAQKGTHRRIGNNTRRVVGWVQKLELIVFLRTHTYVRYICTCMYVGINRFGYYRTGQVHNQV